MIVPPAPAIAAALYRATGIRFKHLPITAEVLLSKMMEAGRRPRRHERRGRAVMAEIRLSEARIPRRGFGAP